MKIIMLIFLLNFLYCASDENREIQPLEIYGACQYKYVEYEFTEINCSGTRTLYTYWNYYRCKEDYTQETCPFATELTPSYEGSLFCDRYLQVFHSNKSCIDAGYPYKCGYYFSSLPCN
jgi:hypothetical protein